MNQSDIHTDLVTVIIPTYNAAKTLPDAIESLLKQTFINWYCIVVDDGSTDETQDVMAAYKSDVRIRYIHQINSGVSAARNKAFSLPAGKYVQFLDADDVLHEKKLEMHVTYLNTHPEVDVVYSDFAHFIEQPEWSAKGEYLENEKIANDTHFLSRLLRANFLRMNTMLFRSSYFKKAGLFNEVFRSVEDYDLWLRGAELGLKFCYLENEFISSAVRTSPNGLSKQYSEMRKNYFHMLQWHWAYGNLSIRHRLFVLGKYALALLQSKEHKPEAMPYKRSSFSFCLNTVICIVVPIHFLRNLFR